MTIPFRRYAKIKDNCCISYVGHSTEYLLQLDLLMPSIQERFPELNFHICCRKEFLHLFNKDYFISLEDFKKNKDQYGFIHDIKCNMKEHPILHFLESCQIPYGPVARCQNDTDSKLCVICLNSVLPTKPMFAKQIENAERLAVNAGYKIEIGTKIDKAGWVIGPENYQVFLAASKGIKTTLAQTGLGTPFYKKLFPDLQILV